MWVLVDLKKKKKKRALLFGGALKFITMALIYKISKMLPSYDVSRYQDVERQIYVEINMYDMMFENVLIKNNTNRARWRFNVTIATTVPYNDAC